MEGVDRLADELGITSSQLALAWCLQVPGVTAPIIGPRTVAQLQDNLGAVEVQLPAATLATIDALNPPGELCRDRGAGPVPRSGDQAGPYRVSCAPRFSGDPAETYGLRQQRVSAGTR